VPPELSKRVEPARGVLPIYVDGKLAKSVQLAQLKRPQRLDRVFGPLDKGVRNVFVHSPSGNKWLTGKQFRTVRVRLNRKGFVKLEPEPVVSGLGKHVRRPHEARPRVRDLKAAGLTKRDLKTMGLRGVTWIEIRTTKSKQLTGEPS
jgi:hypothetical protein